MDPFLKHVARYLAERYGNDIHQVAVVFPNRRAGLYFRHYLSGLYPVPVWSPTIYSMASLARSLTPLRPSDPLSLIFRLYRVYSDLSGVQSSFEDFYFWGEMLLDDFNEVDFQRVDAAQLFSNIRDIKELENSFDFLEPEQRATVQRFWGAIFPESGRELSPSRQRFVEIWRILHEVYSRLKKELAADGQGYPGMIFREAVDTGLDDKLGELGHQAYAFIGFNYLNACEQSLLRRLASRGEGLFFWDYHPDFLEEGHQAGLFMRDNLRHFPPPEDFRPEMGEKSVPGQITAIGVPDQSSQAFILSDLIRDQGLTGEAPDETAVVLGDENLLFRVLDSIPETVGSINATMGFPVRNSLIWQFMGLFARLHENRRADGRYYFKDIMALITHPLFPEAPEKKTALTSAIRLGRRTRVHSADLELSPESARLFEFPGQFAYPDFFNQVAGVLRTYSENVGYQGLHPAELHFLIYAEKRLLEMNQAIRRLNTPVSIKIYKQLLQRIIGHSRVPFEGEPLAGMQVMGFLETRALDFRNLIILGMNEGVLPSPSDIGSFIPQALRRAFSLVTAEIQDARSAYHFHRLIQRTDKVFLVYNQGNTRGSAVEESRFLRQLRFNPDLQPPVNDIRLSGGVGLSVTPPICIPKEGRAMELLMRYSEGGTKFLSASALNCYMDCRLRFYLRYLLEIKKQEEISDEPDNRQAGNILHDCMRNLYQPLIGQGNSTSHLRKLLQNGDYLRTMVETAYIREIEGKGGAKGIEAEGAGILLIDMLYRYVRKILEIDSQIEPLEMVGMEMNLSPAFLEVKTLDRSLGVRISGNADRVDRTGPVTRIVDYKTGPPEKDLTDLGDLFAQGAYGRNHHGFQILLYCWIFRQNIQEPVRPALYYTRQLFAPDFDSRLRMGPARKKVAIDDFSPLNQDFGDALSQLIHEIFNQEVAFDQVADSRLCTYCDYSRICGR